MPILVLTMDIHVFGKYSSFSLIVLYNKYGSIWTDRRAMLGLQLDSIRLQFLTEEMTE